VARAREALATLPWVEPDSGKFDVKTQLVRFTVKDRSAFDLAALDAALKAKKKSFEATLLQGPTG
jgi:hypothetical protein